MSENEMQEIAQEISEKLMSYDCPKSDYRELLRTVKGQIEIDLDACGE